MYVCDGQELEALVLERAQVLAADLGAVLGLREVDLAAETGLAEAGADLEHARHGSRPPRRAAPNRRRSESTA